MKGGKKKKRKSVQEKKKEEKEKKRRLVRGAKLEGEEGGAQKGWFQKYESRGREKEGRTKEQGGAEEAIRSKQGINPLMGERREVARKSILRRRQ